KNDRKRCCAGLTVTTVCQGTGRLKPGEGIVAASGGFGFKIWLIFASGQAARNASWNSGTGVKLRPAHSASRVGSGSPKSNTSNWPLWKATCTRVLCRESSGMVSYQRSSSFTGASADCAWAGTVVMPAPATSAREMPLSAERKVRRPDRMEVAGALIMSVLRQDQAGIEGVRADPSEAFDLRAQSADEVAAGGPVGIIGLVVH